MTMRSAPACRRRSMTRTAWPCWAALTARSTPAVWPVSFTARLTSAGSPASVTRAAEVDLAEAVDRDRRQVAGRDDSRLRLRQVDGQPRLHGDERGREHEEDDQQEHDVDHRREVEGGVRRQGAAPGAVGSHAPP